MFSIDFWKIHRKFDNFWRNYFWKIWRNFGKFLNFLVEFDKIWKIFPINFEFLEFFGHFLLIK